MVILYFMTTIRYLIKELNKHLYIGFEDYSDDQSFNCYLIIKLVISEVLYKILKWTYLPN